MSKKRVHEIARKLKAQGIELDNKEVVSELVALGYDVKSHSSSLEDDQANAAILKIINRRKPKAPAAPVAAKGFVVRRKVAGPAAPAATEANHRDGHEAELATSEASVRPAVQARAETPLPPPAESAPEIPPPAPRAAPSPMPAEVAVPRAPVAQVPISAAPSASPAEVRAPVTPRPLAPPPQPTPEPRPLRPTATQAVVISRPL